MYHALVVEDDVDLAIITEAHLRHAGYDVTKAETCAAAEALIHTQSFDLILLDEMLPDARGDELCRRIRTQCECPIIFMSGIDDSSVIIEALRAGGDDYMVKPVNHAELLARAEAVIRRTKLRGPNHLRQFRRFSVDMNRHKVMRGEDVIELSSIEYALLCYLMDRPDTLVLYHELYQNVWRTDSHGDVRTVMVHISNLRKKLDPEKIGIIGTVRNAGYIFTDT